MPSASIHLYLNNPPQLYQDAIDAYKAEETKRAVAIYNAAHPRGPILPIEKAAAIGFKTLHDKQQVLQNSFHFKAYNGQLTFKAVYEGKYHAGRYFSA